MIDFSDDKVDLFVYQEAKSGNLESGDTYYITKTDDFMLCAIADGLGNGPVAKESADIIPEILEQYKDETLDELLLRCNDLMIQKRGAAVALVKIDYKSQTISYSCVGNVKFYMYKRATDKMIYPLPVMGYLSGRKQRINTQTYACEKNDLFMLHSDGVVMNSPKSTIKVAANARCLYETVFKEIEHGDDSTFIVGSLL
ncbi:PP2C family serine/threonine-protein phosphatase [Psychrobacillus sp. FSL K6-2365]|jgi:phosphoserine phosphatase RsbX|uniref:SpoIIE family protein phosphatase n=1 Tax=Psychrobacillus psychrodurans TaxID=126157 RepID=A0A9X3RAA4_9BACI|nr:PP2C family serine/threonine-protein phosphatase [Psychrobacillus psychrodurans]MCZ8534330.1 SpoIIE family protein phosphatase [Psychrobacillus psychrodurans]MCZ8541112.1 SpoIIE family protein phosphatase [Psychrobacillus psychrodurans]SFM86293.1 negative regulator of sigma-B (phosphoserine phosphatase) [Psychrobacillus psychrodurans]